MILGFQRNKLQIQCEVCSTHYEHNVKSDFKGSNFIAEFGEYENYVCTPCPTCNSIVVVNMNIKLTDEEEGIDRKEFSPEVNAERDAVRLFIKNNRQDFINPTV